MEVDTGPRIPKLQTDMVNPEVHHDPVTMVVTRHVKSASKAEFESLLHDYLAHAEARPGHLGIHVIRPAGTTGTYTVVSNWRASSDLQAWLESPEHQAWMAKIRPLLVAEEQRNITTGLETWFTPPEGGAIVPPPRWKMFFVTWMVVWIVVWVLDIVYAPVIQPLPVALRALLFTVVIVGLLTYVLMPNVTKLLHRFLYPE